MFNKIITENFPNVEKIMPFRYRKPADPWQTWLK
jgi:hypothetical protein